MDILKTDLIKLHKIKTDMIKNMGWKRTVILIGIYILEHESDQFPKAKDNRKSCNN